MTGELDIAGLRALYERATKGVWRHYNEVFRPKFSKRRITEVQRQDGKPIINWGGFDGLPPATARKANHNAAFIVAAHEHWERLLSSEERAQKAEAALRDAIERAAKVCDEFEAFENERAYDKRQAGRDDNFNCARASAATMLAVAIRNLTTNTDEGTRNG